MIEIKNIYKRYRNHHGSNWVLDNVTLTIPSGVSVGLIGANGAGKSTLLRLIAGMDTPDKGSVVRHTRVSWPVGLTGGMQGSLTGRQNVKFVARAQGKSKDIDSIVNFVKDFAEIGDAFDEPVNTYSSGMRSRVSFGLSLAFDFDVYISDEATAVGDRAFKAKAKKLFHDKIDRASLIMVSHSEGILRDTCEAGIYLKLGKAIWYDDINDAIEAYHFDVDKRNIDHPDQAELTVKSNIPPDSYSALLEEYNNRRYQVSGIMTAIKLLKEEGWEREDLQDVIGLYRIRSKEVLEVEHSINMFSEHQEKNNKKKIKKLDKSIKVLEQEYSNLNSEIDGITSVDKNIIQELIFQLKSMKVNPNN